MRAASGRPQGQDGRRRAEILHRGELAEKSGRVLDPGRPGSLLAACVFFSCRSASSGSCRSAKRRRSPIMPSPERSPIISAVSIRSISRSSGNRSGSASLATVDMPGRRVSDRLRHLLCSGTMETAAALAGDLAVLDQSADSHLRAHRRPSHARLRQSSRSNGLVDWQGRWRWSVSAVIFGERFVPRIALQQWRGHRRPRLCFHALHGAAALRHDRAPGSFLPRGQPRSRRLPVAHLLQRDRALDHARHHFRHDPGLHSLSRLFPHPRSPRRHQCHDDRQCHRAPVQGRQRLAVRRRPFVSPDVRHLRRAGAARAVRRRSKGVDI